MIHYQITTQIVFVIFLKFIRGLLYGCSLYLFTLKLDLVPWGDSTRDGLYLLAFFLFLSPVLLVVAFLETFLEKRKGAVGRFFINPIYPPIALSILTFVLINFSNAGFLLLTLTSSALVILALVELTLALRTLTARKDRLSG